MPPKQQTASPPKAPPPPPQPPQKAPPPPQRAPPPPTSAPPPKSKDSLFLMEVLVDKVTFFKSPCFADNSFNTTVAVTAPQMVPIEISDDEGSGGGTGPFSRTFNSGKSCLFSKNESDINSAMSKFVVHVSVYKSLPCGCLPAKIELGRADIDMTKEFVQARNKNLEDPNSVSYQALQDTFRLMGDDNTPTGEISMFLRISCFGSLIMTKFQGVGGPLTLGAGMGSGNIDRSCNPRKSFQTPDEPCVCGTTHGGKKGSKSSFGGSCRGGGSGTCPPARDPYSVMPCEEPDDACFCTGPHPIVKSPLACRNAEQYCLHIPKDCCPPGNKVIFQLPSDTCNNGHKQRAHFNFNSDGIGDMSREEPGQLTLPTSDDYQGVIYDFPKQVYKLRIGKTLESPGRRSKMEYQFITPVVSFGKDVPVRDTRTAQCMPCCPECCGITHQLPRKNC